MFCACANDSDEERINVNICPICLAHPGTLPVINKEAVRHVLAVGAAVQGTLADFSEFDRKSYFYPDIPKGYQISQYQYPLVQGGELAGVKLTRVHLEEDTASSVHQGGKTLVNYNRAGVPLMELVTEPVIRDAETAGQFARELQLLLRTLGVSDANLEKGEMRIEANISVSADGTFGTKVEIKNLNSFRSVERAVAYEIERQSKLLGEGGTVQQETRGWNENIQQTFHQRFKEGSADYRYFPEPDLPKLQISRIPEFKAQALRENMPELPWVRRARYVEAYKLREADAQFIASTLERAELFDAVTIALEGDVKKIQTAANYLVSDLAGIFAKSGHEAYGDIDAAHYAKLIAMNADGTLSSRGTKDVLAELAERGGDPEDVAKRLNVVQISDPAALAGPVDEIITEEADAVAEWHAGKEASLQYLMGKVMKKTRGAGNPEKIRELLIEKLSR
jgi:aspartyl-tRNA(Asn)/glutamyl-tRNA(Gln) amidotransferase subunit B